MSNPDPLTLALAELHVATAGRELDELTLSVYVKYLSQFDPEAAISAISRLILTAKFFPSVGDIATEIHGGDDLRAAEAWANKLPGRDPATDETIRLLGGWRALGQIHVDKMHFTERRFLELYPQVAAKIAANPQLAAPAKKLRIA